MSLIPDQRHRFAIPREIAYFDCAKMSPLLNEAVAAGQAGLARKARPWEIEAPHFFDESEEVRALFAALIGAAADDVAIIPAVSYGLATITANLAPRPGQQIVLLEEDFPSIVFACRALAEASGAELVTVARPQGDWTQALLDAIDERACLVCAPQVHWVYGSLIDLEAVARRCRAVGAQLALDLTQSIGALPLDLAAVDPDWLVAASYKWGLGPYGLGFLYAAPRRQQGQPLEQGWATRQGAHDFRRLSAYPVAFAPGARRFDMGERSNFALLPVAAAAIRALLDWGVANIAETLGARTASLAARLEAVGAEAPAADGRGPHYLSVRFPRPMSDTLVADLAALGVHVSVRGERMRITPHLYNDEVDADRLIEALAAQPLCR